MPIAGKLLSRCCVLGLAIACCGALMLAVQAQAPGPLSGAGENTPRSAPLPRLTPQYGPVGPQAVVADVRITGNKNVPENRVYSFVKTRSGRAFDPEVLQSDVRSLASSGLFRDVKTYTENRPDGVAVTFELFERATVGYIRFVGNEVISDKALGKQVDLKVGDPINIHTVEEGRRKISEFYKTKGFPDVEVQLLEGASPTDAGVVYLVGESPLQRVASVNFIGNTIDTDARLRTQIKSKPGWFWVLGGRLEEAKLDDDVDRLTAYYRALGFFRARIGREVETDASGKWVSLTFVIDEGPRYRLRNVSVAGCQKYSSEQLLTALQLQAGDTFNLGKMNRDVVRLKDVYGSQGHVFADVKADPRFLEEPGLLDLVYQVEEGDMYRVGKIEVKIAGDLTHTRRTVVLNRLSLRPGDIIDMREVRASERRLKASQLFRTEPQNGIEPKIVVKPPELSEIEERLVRDPDRPSGGAGTSRGQSPDGPLAPLAPRVLNFTVEIDAADVDVLSRLPLATEYPAP